MLARLRLPNNVETAERLLLLLLLSGGGGWIAGQTSRRRSSQDVEELADTAGCERQEIESRSLVRRRRRLVFRVGIDDDVVNDKPFVRLIRNMKPLHRFEPHPSKRHPTIAMILDLHFKKEFPSREGRVERVGGERGRGRGRVGFGSDGEGVQDLEAEDLCVWAPPHEDRMVHPGVSTSLGIRRGTNRDSGVVAS